ncbi:MAG: Gfo/Idh/MocA family oxidoreductase, partial [Armatimonadetes bacterium]|nr:Gfo/Idh/MocA family oxidoreductase [Armatimonadota bacterium]
LGSGVIAPTHCKAIQALPNARLVACCDLEEPKVNRLAAEFGIEHVYTDYRAMLEREDVDVVEVVTWSGVHAEQGLAAAAAGKHVLCTKPIDTRLERIDALIAACRSAGVKLGATHQFRSYPGYKRLKQAIDEGRLGRLFLGNGFLKWWRGQEYYDSAAWRGTWALDGGGALMNQAIHYVDMLTWLLGPPRRIRGFLATHCHEIEVEDCATAAIEFENGALGTFQGATCTYQGVPARIEVHGERGNVVLEGDRVIHWNVAGEPLEQAEAGHGSVAGPGGSGGSGVQSHIEQIGDFLAAIEEDREPAISGAEARRAVEMILAIYQSAWSGETVALPLTRDPVPPAA